MTQADLLDCLCIVALILSIVAMGEVVIGVAVSAIGACR